MRIPYTWLVICLTLGNQATPANEGRPADPLLALVPRSAAGVLVVEDLALWWPRIAAQPILKRIPELPQIRESTALRDLHKTRTDMEAVLGLPLDQIRDRVLGQAVVLSLHNPAEGGASPAHGLLLVQLADRALAEKLIAQIDQAQSDLARPAQTRTHHGLTYSLRQFRDRTRPDESWIILPGERFVWSNSEALVREVIDLHQGRGEPLLTRNNFARVHTQWSQDEKSVLGRLYLDLTQLPAESVADSVEREMEQPVRQWLQRSESLAFTVRWDARIILDADLFLLPGALKSTGIRLSAPQSGTIPAAALAETKHAILGDSPPFEGQLDLAWLYQLVLDSLRQSQPEQARGLDEFLRGISLGQDPASGPASALGPRFVTHLQPNAGSSPPWNWLMVMEIQPEGEARAGLENAVRTVFAVLSLDSTSKATIRFPERDEPGSPAIYRFQKGEESLLVVFRNDRLLICNAQNMLDMALAGVPSLPPGAPHGVAQSASRPALAASLTLHADRLNSLLKETRGGLVAEISTRDQRPQAEVERDLDQLHALLDLIQSGTLRIDWSLPEDRIRLSSELLPRP